MNGELWGHIVDPELEATEMHFLKYTLNLPPVQQTWPYMESLDSYHFISCGEKEY